MSIKETLGRTLAAMVALSLPLGAAAADGGEVGPGPQIGTVAHWGRLPIRFEENRGQVDREVRFLARGQGYDLFLTPREAVLVVNRGYPSGERAQDGNEASRQVVRVRPVGGGRPRVAGVGLLAGKAHYFIGDDPRKWRRDIPTFRAVRYRGVYPGIDLVYRGESGRLVFDVVVSPGGDPGVIRLAIEGEGDRSRRSTRIDDRGDLVISIGSRELRWRRPLTFQGAPGARTEIPSSFVLESADRVAFRVGPHDSSRALVIDPTLIYSTYLGSGGVDSPRGIAVDSAGNAHVTGTTGSRRFPTLNPIDENLGGDDVFVSKLDPSGQLVYSTYLGGNDEDSSSSIAVDGAGNVYVTGSTNSGSFPTVNAFQDARRGDLECFVTKIDPAGSTLVYSTFLGAGRDDVALDIGVDAAGSAYLTGETRSNQFPTLNPFQDQRGGGVDGFVARFDAGGALIYSTFLGGENDDSGAALAIDAVGNALVTGSTRSDDFPTLNALQSNRTGGLEGFVAKLDPTGGALVYSTFLGGSDDDFGTGIAVGTAGGVFVAGTTHSRTFPTRSAFQEVLGGARDAFVARLDSGGGSLLYSTFLGGENQDGGGAIAVAPDGSVFVTGHTNSTRFPTRDALQPELKGGFDAFVARLDPSGAALLYSTYLGGSRDDSGAAIDIDVQGNAYVAGSTRSTDLLLRDPIQDTRRRREDGFVARLSPLPPRDLALTKLKVPRRIRLSADTPTRTDVIRVKIQNRSPLKEVVPDLATLQSLVTLTVESLGSCADIVPVLQPPRGGFPITIRSTKRITVFFEITIDCASDPLRSTRKDGGHEDYRCSARVDRSVLGGDADIHPDDDTCPRDPLPGRIDPNPDGTLRDRGCGGKKPDGTPGGEALIDVEVS